MIHLQCIYLENSSMIKGRREERCSRHYIRGSLKTRRPFLHTREQRHKRRSIVANLFSSLPSRSVIITMISYNHYDEIHAILNRVFLVLKRPQKRSYKASYLLMMPQLGPDQDPSTFCNHF